MIQRQKKQSRKLPLLLPSLAIAIHAIVAFWLCFHNVLIIILAYFCASIVIVVLYIAHRNLLSSLEIRKQDITERSNVLRESLLKQEVLSAALAKKNQRYASLKQALDHINQSLHLDEVCSVVTSETFRLFGNLPNTTILLYLLNRQKNTLMLRSLKCGAEDIIIEDKEGDLFDEWVLRRACALIVEDTSKDFRFDPQRIRSEISRPVGSLISMPLVSSTRFVGVLRQESTQQGRFTFEDLRFMVALGNLASISLENSLLYEHTEELAVRDGLTGVYMRRYLDERGREEISYAVRRQSHVSVLMLDVDHFKRRNDEFGHHLGDIILIHIADLLKGVFHKIKDSIVCRYGGEEFAILLPHTKKKEAREIAEQLRKSIQEGVIMLRRTPIKTTVSIGVATYPSDAHSWLDLIKQSDVAMYRAKQKGRNRVC